MITHARPPSSGGGFRVRRLRARARAWRPFLALTVINLLCAVLLAGPVAARGIEFGAGITKAVADSLYCALAGCTMSGSILMPDGSTTFPSLSFANETGMGLRRVNPGRLGIQALVNHLDVDINGSLATFSLQDQIVFNAVTTDITTGANEDLTLGPNGTGEIGFTKHFKSTGAQAVTTAAGSCTTPALAGTDNNFAASAASCGAAGTITGSFGGTWGAAPRCSAGPNDTNAAAGVAFVATTTTTFTVTSKNATGGAAGWTVHCVE